jgi:hypothetical protein
VIVGGSVSTGEANEPAGTDQPHAIVIDSGLPNLPFVVSTLGTDHHRFEINEPYRGQVAAFQELRQAIAYRDVLNGNEDGLWRLGRP